MNGVFFRRGEIRVFAVLIGIILLAGSVHAGLRITFNEPSRRIYDLNTALQAQQEARDVFRIRVNQVNVVQTENDNDVVVMAKATVEKVVRSSQARQTGDVIYIRYRTQDGTGYEDEADPKILEEGANIPAFLSYIGADNHYVLAAGAFSFSLPDEMTAKQENKPAKTEPSAKSASPGSANIEQPDDHSSPKSREHDDLDEPVLE